jgi:hypothetical protein
MIRLRQKMSPGCHWVPFVSAGALIFNLRNFSGNIYGAFFVLEKWSGSLHFGLEML